MANYEAEWEAAKCHGAECVTEWEVRLLACEAAEWEVEMSG